MMSCDRCQSFLICSFQRGSQLSRLRPESSCCRVVVDGGLGGHWLNPLAGLGCVGGWRVWGSCRLCTLADSLPQQD